MNKIVIQIENICKYYTEKNILNSVAFSVFENDIICLLGKTGKGKTTLFNIIAGLDVLFSGSIYTEIAKNKMEYVFQEDILLPWLTVNENLILPTEIKGFKKDAELFHEVIDSLELTEYLNFHPHQLSGGTKRRVSIARALINNPHLLILDEPFNGLDFSMKVKTEKLLKYFIDNKDLKSIIFSSHILESSVNFSTKLLLLDGNNAIHEINVEDNLRTAIKENISKLDRLTIYD